MARTAVRTRVEAAPGAPAGRIRSWSLDHAPRLIGRVAVLLGLALLADAVMPHHWRLYPMIATVLPEPARAAAQALVAVGGLLLLRIARGLRMRKRTEWHVALAVAAAVIATDLVRDDRRPVEAAVAGTLLVLLILARPHYIARADPRSRWYAARVAAQSLVAGTAYGLVMLAVPGHLPAGVSLASRLREVLLSLVGLGGTLPVRGDHYADVFHATLLICGLSALTFAAVLALRPVQQRVTLSPADEQRLRGLLRAHGERDSLGYFALRRDKSVVWSASGKAAITYRVVSGVALASGDPLGDPEAWPGAVAAYRELVERSGWTPAVMGCSELAATVLHRDYGMSAMALGDEAVLHVEDFTLQGRAMRGVRQACTRVERAGYTVAVQRMDRLGADERDEVRAAAAAWRSDPVERGFSMALSRIGDPADGACVVVTARRDGRLAGLLHFVPWSGEGLSLDLMRRDRRADNGLNEFMIARLVQAAPGLGVRRVSLNFAVFRDALERGERIGAGPVLRLWRRALLVASRWWQIESLYRFNDKFAPRWQTRFVCYPRGRDLPRVALAALEAEAFLVRPPALDRLLGRAR